MPGLMAGAPPFPAERLVTLANWQDPPFDWWAFQHVRELIPAADPVRGRPGWRVKVPGRDLGL